MAIRAMRNPPRPGKILREYMGDMDAPGAPSFRYEMQTFHNMWQAQQKKRPRIPRLKAA